MEGEAVIFRDLILETRDGDWGKDQPKDGFVPYRVIRGADFPHVEAGDVGKVPHCYLKESTVSRRTLQPNDLIIETAGGAKERSTGRVLFISKEILECFDLPVTCASFARFLRLDAVRVNPKFVFWLLRLMHLRGEMWQHQVQHTGVARFQFTTFADTCRFDLPPRSTQDTIVEILDGLTSKAILNGHINQKLEAVAQAIFRSWFVDFDPVKAKQAAIAAGRDPECAAMAALSGKLRISKNPADLSAEALIKAEAALDQLSEDQRRQLAQTAALFPDTLVDSELGLIPEGWKIVPFDELAFLDTTSVKPYETPDKLWEHYSIPAYDDCRFPAFEKGSEIKSNKYVVTRSSSFFSLTQMMPLCYL